MPEIRAVAAADMPLLLDLWVASWQTLDLPIDFEARRAWLPGHLVQLGDTGSDILGAYDDAGQIAGFVTINPATGWLDQLAVHPKGFGAGIAKALMNAAKARSPGYVELDVIKGNARAIRFYQREGFVITDEGINPRSGLAIWTMRWQAP